MNLRAWLWLSLVANFTLGVALGWRWSRAETRPEPARAGAQPMTADDLPLPDASRADAAEGALLDWSESMDRFRAAGVPGAILARLVIEHVTQKWTPLEQQAEEDYLNGRIDARRLAELHDERAREQEAALRQALGEGYAAWDKQTTVDNMYLGGLVPTDTQRDALYPLQKRYLERLHELEVNQRNGVLDEPTRVAAQAQVEANYKLQLAAIIGADRVEGLSGENDPVAQVRRDFARLQLSDVQVSELAAVQQKWADLRATMAKSLEATREIDVAYEGDLRAIDRVRDEEFRRILGAPVFEAWEQARDDRYATLQQQAGSWHLEPQDIDTVYHAIRAYDLAVANYEHQAQVREHEGQRVDWTEVYAVLAEYTRQTERSLRQYLGDDRFEQMQQREIFGLRPQPASP